MNHKWKVAISCFAVLALLTVVVSGCAEEGIEGKKVIKVGLITDITGPAGAALVPNTWAIEDWTKYINEEDPIPGVEIKLIIYDCKYDPSRDIPGYEWLRAQGVELIFVVVSTTGEILRPIADEDKIALLAGSGVTEAQIEPPGWLFSLKRDLHPPIRLRMIMFIIK